MAKLQHTSRPNERKHFILESMRRLNRPVCLSDLDPKASDYSAYTTAFKSLLADGTIVVADVGAFRRKFYALARRQEDMADR
jgi:hypothetical protein